MRRKLRSSAHAADRFSRPSSNLGTAERWGPKLELEEPGDHRFVLDAPVELHLRAGVAPPERLSAPAGRRFPGPRVNPVCRAERGDLCLKI